VGILSVDFWEFVARSEWPAIVGAGLWLFRRDIKEMIGRVNLTKVDAWGLKAEFENGLAKAELLTPPKAEEAPSHEGPKLAMDEAPSRTVASDTAPRRIETASPELIVMRAWRELDIAMKRALEHLRKRKITFLPAGLERLGDELGLTPEESESIRVIRRLRNSIAHANSVPITLEDAERYRELAQHLARTILARLEAKKTEGRRSQH
jgi:hypothetical protein